MGLAVLMERVEALSDEVDRIRLKTIIRGFRTLDYYLGREYYWLWIQRHIATIFHIDL